MNILPFDKQSLVLTLLAEGNSLRSVSRIAGVSRNTINKLLLNAGQKAAGILSREMMNLKVNRLEIDETWSYILKKQKRLTEEESKNPQIGDQYVFVAMDAETKAVVTFRVGKRNESNAYFFMQDVSSRIATRFQLTTDSFAPYLNVVDATFGNDIDYAQITKHYREGNATDERRYSPASIVRITRKPLIGEPKRKYVSTSYIERQNLTMRMQMRRFTRLTNAFSKKYDQLCAAIALHFFHYNFCRIHETLRVTPAMQAGLTRTIWTWESLFEYGQQELEAA